MVEVLRLGAYQLLYMGGVPDYAAVSQAVAQGRSVGGEGVARLVNAVLRALARTGDDPALFPDPSERPAEWLATWGSHPRWLVDRWLGRWSFDSVRRLVEANNRVPPLTILPLDHGPEEAVRLLELGGVGARPVGGGSDSVELEAGADPAVVLAALCAIVQDPGASLVATFAAPPPDALVADLCAAPGGKAIAMSRSGCRVVAADPSRSRLRLLRENVARTGAPVAVYLGRAENPAVRAADLVLVDVPCTGTGTLRRHPDARWRVDPERLGALTRLQDGILRGAADVVSSGGLLVYATCSLEPEENRRRVEAFLADRPDFCLEEGGSRAERKFVREGCLEVLPQESGFDGAFAARLRRSG